MLPFPPMLLPSPVPEPDTATETAYSSLEPEEAILTLVKTWGVCGCLGFFFVCFYDLSAICSVQLNGYLSAELKSGTSKDEIPVAVLQSKLMHCKLLGFFFFPFPSCIVVAERLFGKG